MRISHGHSTCMQPHTQTRIHLVEKSQRVDRRANIYHDYHVYHMVETSSIQTQNLKYFKDRENQYIDMTQVPRMFYRQATYNNQKQAYVFVKNDAIVPIENSMHVIYHDPIKKISI